MTPPFSESGNGHGREWIPVHPPNQKWGPIQLHSFKYDALLDIRKYGGQKPAPEGMMGSWIDPCPTAHLEVAAPPSAVTPLSNESEL